MCQNIIFPLATKSSSCNLCRHGNTDPPVLQTRAVEYGGHRASKSEITTLKASDKFCGIAVHNELVWFSEYML